MNTDDEVDYNMVEDIEDEESRVIPENIEDSDSTDDIDEDDSHNSSEISEDSDSIDDMNDEEDDNSGRSSSASQMIWSVNDSSESEEFQDDPPSTVNQDIAGSIDSGMPNISQQPSGSQSDGERSSSPYNPRLDLHIYLRNYHENHNIYNPAMDFEDFEEPSYPNSLENIEEPQTSSTSANNYDDESADDAFSCPICLDVLTSSGNHRPACLKCGHIFGEQCIERWIKNGCNTEARRCPTCNTKTSLRDVRILYAKKLIAVDTVQLNDLQTKLEIEVKKNLVLTSESHALVQKAEHLTRENETLKYMISVGGNPQTNAPTTQRSLLKNIKLCKTSGCRVMAYNKTSMMLVVSHTPETTLFNKQVIRKMNTTLMVPLEENIYAHTKQIRDMEFHPIEHNVLASVGLDKCISIIDVMSNTVVSTVTVDEPLWSCCWAGDNSNVLVAGGQLGSLYYIDKRFMKVLYSEQNRAPACVSLVSIPPSSTRTFSNGGFLRTRMDVFSMFESSLTPKLYHETKLPIHGLWSSASYDTRYNHILLSSKPCGYNKATRHIVSRLSSLGEDCPTFQPVVTFYGGDKATLLTRSCLVPAKEPCDETLVAYFDEKSNSIQLSSLNSNTTVHKFFVNESFLDLCYLDGVVMNSRRVIAALSAKSISIYCV